VIICTTVCSYTLFSDQADTVLDDFVSQGLKSFAFAGVSAESDSKAGQAMLIDKLTDLLIEVTNLLSECSILIKCTCS